MAYLKATNLMLAAAAAAFSISAAAQTPQAATPAPAPAPAPAATDMDAGYVIGQGDVIEVTVLGQPEFTTRARVRADGTIALPFLGDTSVDGKTGLVLADEIAAKLRAGGYYAKPVTNVEVVGYASNYVTMLGAIGSPGLQPIDREYRVSEVIARAGGIRPDGADYVILRRETGEELRLPFEKLAMGGDADDPVVLPGDKLYVPPAENYFIYGQINAPGAFPLKGELTLRKAIARSGGVTPSGSMKRVKVFRNGVEQRAELENPVQPGDVIVIGERLF